MADKKFSDFTPEGNLSAYTGLVGYDATDNYFITPTELNTALEGTLYSTSPLPISKGGTGINPAAPANVLSVPFVGKLINESILPIHDQLVISDNGSGGSVLNTIPNSFSFMATVNQALPNVGYGAGAWNNAGWEYSPTGAFLKYTQTSANPKIRKSHFKEQEKNCELEMTISLSGVSTATYDWELRLVDPTGVAATQIVTSSAAVGATPTMNDFDSGAGTWGAGWQQVRVTGVNLIYFVHPSLPTEGELELYINGTSGWANVGCSVRFMSN